MMLFFSLLAAVMVQSDTPDWRPLSGPQQVTLSWDAASVTRSGEVTSVHMRAVHVPARQGENAFFISRVELRCAANEVRTAETVNYAANGVSGDRDTTPGPFRAIPETSSFAELRDLACSPTAP